MFKRLQLKMTLYYSLILIAILIATNLSIYFVMVNYNNYQMSSEINRMLDGIQGSEWLYENNEASTEASSDDSDSDSDSDSESEDKDKDEDEGASNDSSSHSEVTLPGVKDLIIPQTLKSFPVYMIYDVSGQLVTWKSDNETTFDKLLIKSKDLKISDNPNIVALVEPSEGHYLMAKMPITISDQTLGYYVVARDVTIAYQTLENLSKILVFSLIAGIFVSAGLGYLIAGKSLRPIKEAYQSKQEFLANASHELKTPLSVIDRKSVV